MYTVSIEKRPTKHYFPLDNMYVDSLIQRYCPWGVPNNTKWVGENDNKLIVVVDTPSHGGFILFSTIRFPHFEGVTRCPSMILPIAFEKHIYMYSFEEDCDMPILGVCDTDAHQYLTRGDSDRERMLIEWTVQWQGENTEKWNNHMLPQIMVAMETMGD